MKLMVSLRKDFYDALDTNTDASIAWYSVFQKEEGALPPSFA